MILGTPAFNIVMSIVAILATCGAIYGLFILVKYIEKKFREELDVLSEDFIPKKELKSVVDTYINRVGQFGSFAMFLVDIDDFSGVNEAVGQERGDRILKEFAHRISRKFSRTAIISRYGADQILVLEKSDVMFSEIDAVASDLNEIIREPFEVAQGEEINITASMGIALYPTCGTSYKELSRSLEIATFVAKRNGGNNYQIYHSDMDAEESTNLEYYREVRKAVANKEFCLYYQPIIDINEKTLHGFEAFLRWNHPTLGLLTPPKFLHILERSGDINTIAKWGLELLILKLHDLQVKYPDNKYIYAYNLSTKQLSSDTIANDFRQLVGKYRLDASRICLEIEEYALFQKIDVVKRNILKLRDLGFKISVDGLGLDYATLSHIEKEPIDTLKLDKGFLEDVENNFMTERIVGMLVESSNNLNREVIQEGIENFQQVEYIQSQHIKYAQGYYFSVPLESSEMSSYIEQASYVRQLDPSIHHFAYGEDDDETRVKDEEVSTEAVAPETAPTTEEKPAE